MGSALTNFLTPFLFRLFLYFTNLFHKKIDLDNTFVKIILKSERRYNPTSCSPSLSPVRRKEKGTACLPRRILQFFVAASAGEVRPCCGGHCFFHQSIIDIYKRSVLYLKNKNNFLTWLPAPFRKDDIILNIIRTTLYFIQLCFFRECGSTTLLGQYMTQTECCFFRILFFCLFMRHSHAGSDCCLKQWVKRDRRNNAFSVNPHLRPLENYRH